MTKPLPSHARFEFQETPLWAIGEWDAFRDRDGQTTTMASYWIHLCELDINPLTGKSLSDFQRACALNWRAARSALDEAKRMSAPIQY